MANIYGVTFKGSKKTHYYSGDNYKLDDLVVITTDKGEKIAKVLKVLEGKKDASVEKITRLASVEDYDKFLNNLKDADKALKKCKSLVLDYKLPMRILSAEYNLDRSQLIFMFTADERIDFRELAKRLASIYHTRIELRQIGARDKAKEVGGIGICGGELCCHSFLKKIDTVSMNMAKNQNLALNPSKINGCCGRLLCCLLYEDENYTKCSKNLPKVGEKIELNGKEGTIVAVDVLNRKLKVLVDGEKIDYVIESEK